MVVSMHDETNFSAMPKNTAAHSETAEPTFKVLIAYDHAPNARRAILLMDGLAGRLLGEIELRRDIWRFDVISLLGTREDALRDVMNADFVVVAADAGRDLPNSVKGWLEAWAGRQIPGGKTLVTLLERDSSTPIHCSPARSFLQDLAAEEGIQFFTREFKSPPDHPEAVFAKIQIPWLNRSHPVRLS
jgi:hypothetical protein